MKFLVMILFIFSMGCLFGWVLEVFFRRFFSKNNPERKWINPGFCSGPSLPLYGSGLTILFLLARLENYMTFTSPLGSKVILFTIMAFCMTGIEYLAGYTSLKYYQVRLWDYSNEWGNIQGIICPKFSLAWAILGAMYYFLIDPHILDALAWLSGNLAFSFFIGMYYGIFIIDVIHSLSLIARIRQFAKENEIIVRIERVKTQIEASQKKAQERFHFLLPFHTSHSLREVLNEALEEFKDIVERRN